MRIVGRPRLAAAFGVVALAVILTSGIAHAGLQPGTDTGNYGPHWLRESDEYPGIQCIYQESSSSLVRIRIRPPVVQALDRGPGVQSQVVGWQYRIEYSDDGGSTWYRYAQSDVKKATATEHAPATFKNRSYTFPSVTAHDDYRVRIRMFWYYPNSTTKDGTADHETYFVELAKGGDTTLVSRSCPRQFPIVGAGHVPANHTGDYGLHWLRDSEEFAGVRCTYDAVTGILRKIRVRPPVMQALDRGPGIQSQVVGWRFRIEYSDDAFQTFDRQYRSDVKKATATEHQPGTFKSRTYTFPAAPSHSAYRVWVEMFWFYPNATTKDGRADHWVYYHEFVRGGMTDETSGWCDRTFET